MKSQLMNDTVTLYHKKGEDINGRSEYLRYILKNVRFECRESVLPVKAGLSPYNSFKLFVDISSRGGNEGLIYAKRHDYEALSDVAKLCCWTISENDFITEGQTSFPMEEMSLDEVKNLCEVFTVNRISKNKLGKTEILEISGRGRMIY